jgi:hypothetical protein
MNLPDCRTIRPLNAKRHRLANWVPMYCANCGADGGYVPEDMKQVAFYLCDSCWEKHGAIAGAMAVSDDVFRKQFEEGS